jgi:transcription initiation factor IIE alpha subunit
MKITLKKFRCPLCGSLLTYNRYNEIIGVWKERQKLEKALRERTIAKSSRGKTEITSRKERVQNTNGKTDEESCERSF